MKNQYKKVNTKILREVDRLTPDIIKIAKDIHARPELPHNEFFASDLLTSFLSSNGFTINKGVAGLKTAFTARLLPSNKKNPSIALIAEYDALPSIGHACGHNMIAAISAGAGAVLSGSGLQKDADILVIGTPAEEGGGGKITMIDKGIFSNIDISLMAHPSNHTRLIARMLAFVELNFIFTGKSSHAAASPNEGINALDGVILTFNNINALRQQLRDDARVHGIITDGGKAPNIIPDRAVAKFFVRAIDIHYFNKLIPKIKNCARGAAKATNCRLRIETGKMVYRPFKPSYEIAEIFSRYLLSEGINEDKIGDREGIGSSDIGNVSQIMPTLHAEFSVGPNHIVNHSPEFTKQTVSEFGLERMIKITRAIALTAAEIIFSKKRLKKIKEEFVNSEMP